jgi:hypothetical protein
VFFIYSSTYIIITLFTAEHDAFRSLLGGRIKSWRLLPCMPWSLTVTCSVVQTDTKLFSFFLYIFCSLASRIFISMEKPVLLLCSEKIGTSNMLVLYLQMQQPFCTFSCEGRLQFSWGYMHPFINYCSSFQKKLIIVAISYWIKLKLQQCLHMWSLNVAWFHCSHSKDILVWVMTILFDIYHTRKSTMIYKLGI